MDGHELISSWPGLSDADAVTLLASPAWRLLVDFDGGECRVTRTDVAERELLLKVALDDEPGILGIADSETFTDLHMLWTRLADLPEALVIALVEKEVGPLLQTIENIMRKELRLEGMASGEKDGGAARTGFTLQAETFELGFSLALSSETVRRLGTLDNLDPNHDAVRALTRPVRAQYAVVDAADRSATVKTGDLLLVDGIEPSWLAELPDDEAFRVCSDAETSVSFAQFADDALPPVPEPSALTVFRRGQPFALAEITTIGDASAIKLTRIL